MVRQMKKQKRGGLSTVSKGRRLKMKKKKEGGSAVQWWPAVAGSAEESGVGCGGWPSPEVKMIAGPKDPQMKWVIIHLSRAARNKFLSSTDLLSS